jgi:ATP-binding protein involved in chromosome partitioning
VPLDVTVRQGADVGVPAVAQSQPGPAAAALSHIARAVAGKVSVEAAREQPVLTVS